MNVCCFVPFFCLVLLVRAVGFMPSVFVCMLHMLRFLFFRSFMLFWGFVFCFLFFLRCFYFHALGMLSSGLSTISMRDVS